MRSRQRRSQDFGLGGPPGTFSVISPGSRPHSVGGGGGVVAGIFRDLVYPVRFSGGGGGGVVAEIFPVSFGASGSGGGG